MRVLLLLVTAALTYFLGGINGAVVSARLVFRKSARSFGGSAGLNNYYRRFGLPAMIPVALIDIVKSVLAVLIGGWLLGLTGAKEAGRLFAGFCVTLGHVFPLRDRFRGGKGVMCAAVTALLVDWRVGVCCLAAFAVALIFSSYVSLSSIVAAAAFPLMMLAFSHEGLYCLLALLCALLVMIRHAENIVRLIGGTENRLKLSGKRHFRDEDFEDPD